MNKRGLSTIVATLIIILLVLVAVGLIWVVVRNVIQDSAEQVQLGRFTLDLSIEQVQLNENQVSVKLKRNAGDGDFVALKFVVDDWIIQIRKIKFGRTIALDNPYRSLELD